MASGSFLSCQSDSSYALPFDLPSFLLTDSPHRVGVASFIVTWNALGVVGWEDLQGMHHDPLSLVSLMGEQQQQQTMHDFAVPLPLLFLPMAGFTLSAPALALLLVFKTNTSYQRWDEARKAWETVKNNSRSIARQTTAWVYESDQLTNEEKYRLMRRIADALWLFPRTLQTHLIHPVEDEDAYRRDIRTRVEYRPLAEEYVRHKT